MDMAEQVTHGKVINICKVQWSHHTKHEATWEQEENSKQTTQSSFPARPNLRCEIAFKGVGL
jgi:hypothetical protein